MIIIDLNEAVNYSACFILAICVIMIPILTGILWVIDDIRDEHPVAKWVSLALLIFDIFIITNAIYNVIFGGMI